MASVAHRPAHWRSARGIKGPKICTTADTLLWCPPQANSNAARLYTGGMPPFRALFTRAASRRSLIGKLGRRRQTAEQTAVVHWCTHGRNAVGGRRAEGGKVLRSELRRMTEISAAPLILLLRRCGKPEGKAQSGREILQLSQLSPYGLPIVQPMI